MSEHENNLAALQAMLMQLYSDYLERLRAQGVSESLIQTGMEGFLQGSYHLTFTACITPQLLALNCAAGEQHLFDAEVTVKLNETSGGKLH